MRAAALEIYSDFLDGKRIYSVALAEGPDIEESQRLFAFKQLERWNLSWYHTLLVEARQRGVAFLLKWLRGLVDAFPGLQTFDDTAENTRRHCYCDKLGIWK